MALIKSVKEIEHFFPKPNKEFYMSMITHTEEKVLLTNTIYAIELNEKEGKVDNIYRAAFSLFACPSSYYLFLRNAAKELTAGAPFLKCDIHEGEIPKIEDWGFKTDELGIYIEKKDLFSCKKIYFSTSHFDVVQVRESINKKNKSNILVLETVYV